MDAATGAGDFEIASLVASVLCAHLFFTTRRKQVFMILVASIIPVAASAIRASATVLVPVPGVV